MRIKRLLLIQIILIKHGLDELAWSHPLFKPFAWLRHCMPWRWFKRPKPNPKAIREALIELGPIYVKFGQLLSTRRDLLPDALVDELEKLQDQVPPFDPLIAKTLIEDRLGSPIETVFDRFDEHPLASASIAQVHTGLLNTGEEVAIKVLRPNIKASIEVDVQLLMAFAKIVHRAFPKLRRFKPIHIVQEFKRHLYDELDLLRDAANASQLRRNFLNSDLLYVPQVYWDYCHSDVMVMERIYGVSIAHKDKLIEAGVNLKLLAEKGVEIFFTQVFRDCFFHADMHPGNIFVDIKNPENPKYIAIDFGIMGTLSSQDQQYLAANFLAFFKRDYRKVAQLHVESGWIPSHVRVDEFEASIRTVCEPIFEKPLRDISFGQSLLKLFQTAQQFDMEVQPQLLLLQKTLLSIEGLGKHLYPDLDLWHTAKPFLEKWMKQRFSSQALRRTLKEKIPQWLNQLPELPDAIRDITLHLQKEAHHKTVTQPAPSSSLSWAVLTGACLVSGVLLISLNQPPLWWQKHSVLLGASLGLLGLVCWLQLKPSTKA